MLTYLEEMTIWDEWDFNCGPFCVCPSRWQRKTSISYPLEKKVILDILFISKVCVVSGKLVGRFSFSDPGSLLNRLCSMSNNPFTHCKYSIIAKITTFSLLCTDFRMFTDCHNHNILADLSEFPVAAIASTSSAMAVYMALVNLVLKAEIAIFLRPATAYGVEEQRLGFISGAIVGGIHEIDHRLHGGLIVICQFKNSSRGFLNALWVGSLADKYNGDVSLTSKVPALRALRKKGDWSQTMTLCTLNVLLPQVIVRSEYSPEGSLPRERIRSLRKKH